ncbi:helix-turn-helix domain-containing protein [Amphibacillus sp. Q70]|uniref:helix-turn-helix domain-containing protein n=1 Tax=Amphibacillus sp. Q70 TaxID=3453416 RepID=UPI003F863767
MGNFSERIYQLRKELGVTQEEIATKLKVSRQTISNWESGAAQPTIDKAIELANLYDVSMDELIGIDKKKTKEPSAVLLSLMHQQVSLYLDPKIDNDAWMSVQKTKIRNCEIIEVNPNSIRIIMNEKKQRIEKLIFLKDISGFEMEVN